MSRIVKGLSQAEAHHRLIQFGPNEIRKERATSAFRLLLRQFEGPLVLLLLGACVLSGFLGDLADSIAIASILVINALVGFAQEFRAERAVIALRSMTAPRARVIRDGRAVMIPARDVVPGDLLILEAGDIIAADAKLLEAHLLQTNEAPLTGESTPVEKNSEVTSASTHLAERHDHVFLGTSVTRGSGVAEVIATGMRTELGKIAHLIQTATSGPTPLQVRLEQLSRVLLFLCLGIVTVIGLIDWLHGRPLVDLLLSSISLAVAAVPEGMPAIVTVALALGVQRMAERNVLVRRLPSVETLGSANVICTDKTGTLTTGIMIVRDLWGEDHHAILHAAAACNDAELHEDGKSGNGDPTEVALLMAAREHGIQRSEIESANPRKAVFPFDSDRKRMSILRADGVLYVKGALEFILPLCTSGTERAHEENEEMAKQGLRVLAIATGGIKEERDLRLLGLVGIADPPRTEAIEAVAAARAAGIQTVMITGDHPLTAQAIARELGILTRDDDPRVVLHARATAEDKIGIVREWKKRGAIVAMTGDGVNDAPALREAHIGIAMGKTGTEVTREASDLILTDDNYASIVAAVREGRGVFNNIRRTLIFLLAGNASELAIVFAASLVGTPLPFLPIQLLWINLVTDGLPALALVAEPVLKDVMKAPPRKLSEPMLGKQEWRTVAFQGTLDSVIVLGVFFWTLHHQGVSHARSMAFSVLVFCQMFRSLSVRSTRKTAWQLGFFSNLWLVSAVFSSILLQIGIFYIPFTRDLLHLGPMSIDDWTLTLLLGLIPVSVIEANKLLHSGKQRRATA